jgi:hypothetical protein
VALEAFDDCRSVKQAKADAERAGDYILAAYEGMQNRMGVTAPPQGSPEGGTMKKVPMPKVSKKELRVALDRLCQELGTTSRGFDVGAINGPDQWALKYTPGCGWMVVCGLGGCGAALSRWNGYIRYRWNLLMALEMAQITMRKQTPRGRA